MREKSKKSFKKSVDTGETELAHMEAGDLGDSPWALGQLFVEEKSQPQIGFRKSSRLMKGLNIDRFYK